MSEHDQQHLKSLLKGLISRNGLSDRELDALLDYAYSQSHNNEQEFLKKISNLLGQNVSGAMQIQSAVQLELHKHDNEAIHRKLAELTAQVADIARSHPKPEIKWQVVQGIFTAISFIASVVALLKAFNFLLL
jgi:hypothetical protein